MSWWHRKKRKTTAQSIDEFVARERAEAEAVHDDTRKQAEEAASLRAESSQVHERAKKIREANHFTTWLTHALRGVQGDGQ